MINNPRYATIDIGQNGQWRTIWVSRRQWQSVAFVDYIELTPEGQLLPLYVETYTPSECNAMLTIAKKDIPVVGPQENVIDTRGEQQ